jgi:hypothetical protein
VHDDSRATYTYDTRDLLATVTNATLATDPNPKVTTYTYTPRGQTLGEVKGNGNTVDYTYWLDGLPRTQTEKKPSGVLVSSHALDYNPNGHKIRDAARTMNADNHAAYLDVVYT